MKKNKIIPFYLTIFILFLFNHVFSQNNLITVNPDFIENTNGWKNTGESQLTHIAEGALTAGAAQLKVLMPDDNFSKARLRSETFNIPDELSEKLLILTFYARSTQPLNFRISFKLYDSNDIATSYNSSPYTIDSGFRKYFFPLYIESQFTQFQLEIQCGKEAGIYIFDDFLFTYREVSTDDLALSEAWRPRLFRTPENVLWQSAGTGDADVTISFDTEDSLAPVLDAQFGVNSNFRSKNSITERVNLYKEMGSFRYPAGSGSNQYFFDCNIPDEFAIDVNAYCGTSSKYTDPEHYVEFLHNAGGEGTIVVNYFYARYGVTPEGTREARVSQAAGYAADFVRKMNIELDGGIKYWEVGNECYGSWETGYNVNGSIVTGKEYGEDFRVFADSMKNVDPDIMVGAVLSHNDFDWDAQVISEVKNSADFFIIHHYFHNIESAYLSEKQLIELKNDIKEVELMVQEYTDKPAGYLPLALTEFNIQGEYTTTIANGLFTADALATIVRNHYSMSTIWVNEWNIDEYNVTHGIIAKNDPDQPDYTVRPVYTPYYYYGKCFGDHLISCNVSGSSQVHAHASAFHSGETGLSVLNYSGVEQKVTFDFDPALNYDTLYLYSVYATSQTPGNKKFFVNGFTGETAGGGPVDLDPVPAVAMVWSPQSILTLPPYSINFIVLKGDKNHLGIQDKKNDHRRLRIYPNPVSDWLFVEGSEAELNNLKLFNTAGQCVNSSIRIETTGTGKATIRLSALSPGIYFLKNRSDFKKIVVK